MSILPKLRVVNERSEIINLLLRQYQSEKAFLLWQKDIKSNKRSIHTALLTGLDRTAGRISLGPTGGSWLTEINLKLPVYLKGEDQELLFKLSIPRLHQGEIIADLPFNVRALEKRLENRFALDLSHQKNILHVHKFYKKEKVRTIPVSVIDISQGGMGVAIPIHEQKYFYEGDSLFASGFRQVENFERLAGKIVYLKSFHRGATVASSRLFRVGICFENALTLKQLNLFKELSR